jgi:hypothetical protein
MILNDCRNGNMLEKNVEQQALKISNLDSNELLLFHHFSYGIRGGNDFWMRISRDTSLYACTYKIKEDTTELSVFRPYNFKNDFACSFAFDTSQYEKFGFSVNKSKIVRISLNDTAGHDYYIDTSLLVSQLFPSQNPLQTFAKLTALKDSLGFIGTKYDSNIGDLTVFWLTPQYNLHTSQTL